MNLDDKDIIFSICNYLSYDEISNFLGSCKKLYNLFQLYIFDDFFEYNKIIKKKKFRKF